MCLAIPVRVIKIVSSETVRVEVNGLTLDVSTLLTPDVAIGDDVLVHAGFILEKLTPEDAADKRSLLEEFRQKTLRGEK
jgi:hydrogenase expression/formation protein HypC